MNLSIGMLISLVFFGAGIFMLLTNIAIITDNIKIVPINIIFFIVIYYLKLSIIYLNQLK